MQSVPITTKVVRLNLVHGEVHSIQLYVIKFSATGRWFFPDIPGSSTNKTDYHHEILLKVALNTFDLRLLIILLVTSVFSCWYVVKQNIWRQNVLINVQLNRFNKWWNIFYWSERSMSQVCTLRYILDNYDWLRLYGVAGDYAQMLIDILCFSVSRAYDSRCAKVICTVGNIIYE